MWWWWKEAEKAGSGPWRCLSSLVKEALWTQLTLQPLDDSCQRCCRTLAPPQPVQLWTFISQCISPGKHNSIALKEKSWGEFKNLCCGPASHYPWICFHSPWQQSLVYYVSSPNTLPVFFYPPDFWELLSLIRKPGSEGTVRVGENLQLQSTYTAGGVLGDMYTSSIVIQFSVGGDEDSR